MRSPALPRAVAVVGPTASGKAALGVEIAARCGGEIIVCDSVKVYRGLDIGSAKPSRAVQARTTHRLIDVAGPDEVFTAARYAQLAWTEIRHGHRLFVGGTGFYLRATAWTMTEDDADDPTAPTPEVRAALDAQWSAREHASPGAAHRALTAADPETAAAIHPHNLVRITRALWLCQWCGGPISALRRRDPPRARLNLTLVVLDPGPGVLRARIENRIDRMLAAGWIDEVERLRGAGYDDRSKAMLSLGYRQIVDVVCGRTSVAQARADIIAATWQYARRQRTYFRHQLPARDVVHITDPKDLPWAQVEAVLTSEAASPGASSE